MVAHFVHKPRPKPTRPLKPSKLVNDTWIPLRDVYFSIFMTFKVICTDLKTILILVHLTPPIFLKTLYSITIICNFMFSYISSINATIIQLKWHDILKVQL